MKDTKLRRYVRRNDNVGMSVGYATVVDWCSERGRMIKIKGACVQDD